MISSLSGAALFIRKHVDDHWEQCDVGGREVRSLALDTEGNLYAAANIRSKGDVLVSADRCKTFAPLGLSTKAVWHVTYLHDKGLVCAATGDGLFCGASRPLRPTLLQPDIYFVTETTDALVAGGFPYLYRSVRDGAFERVAHVSYAASASTTTPAGLLVAGPGLLISTDNGRTFQQSPDITAPLRALAAMGRRVYAAGGASLFYRSDDGGASWKQRPSPGFQTEAILLPTEDPDIVLVGTHGDLRPGDVYLSVDGAQSWTALGCPGAEIHTLASDGSYLYCGATALFGKRGLWRMSLARFEQ